MIEITNDNFKNPEYNQKGNNKYILYLHKSPSNKYYVGITCQGVERRWRIDGSGYYQCPYFYSAIQKYGWNNFKHFIIREGMTKEDAENAEINLIKHLREDNYSLYNISNGGNASFAGIPLSEEHKRKISESNKGKPPTIKTEDGIRRLKESLKGNKRALGYHHTEETREKISNSLKGRKCAQFTDEHKKHISESKKGWVMSEEQRKKISERMKGNKPSEKSIQRLIEYNKTRECPENLLKKLSKPVVQYDINMNLIAEYPSAMDAARKNDCDNSAINKCCKGQLKSVKGFIWKYKEKEKENNEEEYDVAL